MMLGPEDPQRVRLPRWLRGVTFMKGIRNAVATDTSFNKKFTLQKLHFQKPPPGVLKMGTPRGFRTDPPRQPSAAHVNRGAPGAPQICSFAYTSEYRYSKTKLTTAFHPRCQYF